MVLGAQVAPESRGRRVDALVAVDGGVGDGGQAFGMVEDATEEVIGQAGEAQFVASELLEEVGFTGQIPERNVGVAAIAGEVGEGFGHEGGAQAVFLGDGFDHVFEEAVLVRRGRTASA